MDKLLSKVKSKLGNTCANVYTQGKFTTVKLGSGSSQKLLGYQKQGVPEKCLKLLIYSWMKTTKFLISANLPEPPVFFTVLVTYVTMLSMLSCDVHNKNSL